MGHTVAGEKKTSHVWRVLCLVELRHRVRDASIGQDPQPQGSIFHFLL